jgi:NACalpha-BTF3-like transcription factor
MQGVGLKKVEGIQRVTLRRPRGVSINLSNANVTNIFTAPLRGCQTRGVQVCCV